MNDTNWLINEIKLHMEAFGEFDLKDLEELEKQVKESNDAYLKSIEDLYVIYEKFENDLKQLQEELIQFNEKVKTFNDSIMS